MGQLEAPGARGLLRNGLGRGEVETRGRECGAGLDCPVGVGNRAWRSDFLRRREPSCGTSSAKNFMVVFAQNSCAEGLRPSVAVFGNRASKEVNEVKWDHKGGPLLQQD